MDTSYIIGMLSIVVTFICGIIAKRVPWFNNNLIPLQNLSTNWTPGYGAGG